ncbi:MAG: type II toxin-antitoxin system VapC family toxin [Candidatus Solibacter sp.]|jgi:predicted nucleic acid-binding protein
MMLFYLDSSAWVKRYYRELGSDWINQQFEQEILFGGSTLGLIEVMATCARKRTAGAIDAVRFQQIESDLLDDWNGLFQMELTSGVVQRSLELASTFGLRGADSVHLASALMLREKLAVDSNEFTFVASDLEPKAAALKAGLAVVDPQEEA